MYGTDRFTELVQGAEEDITLDAACLLIAARTRSAADPDAVVAAGRAELDDLAGGCAGATLDDVRAHLFGTLGFTGNRLHYEDPRNSFLDDVLARRTGIPITLAVVVIEVGRRLGLRLDPVGMPGHFLVGAGQGWYLDAFEGGRLLDEEGCRNRFHELAGPGAPWSRDLLDPVGPRAVVSRVLANLRAVYARSQNIQRLDGVLELRQAIPGAGDEERAERASVLAALGRYDEAARQLELLADAAAAQGRHPSGGPAPDDGAAAALRSRAARLRARLN
ncbi:MAG TPA: transglutaminase-like domain-containing protein [Acidimicrobiales bacterium]